MDNGSDRALNRSISQSPSPRSTKKRTVKEEQMGSTVLLLPRYEITDNPVHIRACRHEHVDSLELRLALAMTGD